MKIRGHLLVALIVTAWLGAPGDARAEGITARVSQSEAAVGDPIRLTLAVEGDSDGGPRLPELPGFTVRGGNRVSKMQMINGRVTTGADYEYVLTAQAPGTYTVGAAEVTIGGRVFKSQPFTLRIVAAGAAAAARDRLAFVTAEVTSASPYVGEQVNYRFKFFRRTAVASANLTPLTFDGFIDEPLGEQRVSTSVVNGVEYQVTEIVHALFPQQAGALTIPAAVLNVDLVVQDRRRRSADPFEDLFGGSFGGMGGRHEPRTLRSQALTLNVRPLPQPAPAAFTGLVGSFTVAASASKTSLKAGESTTVSLTLSGEGNLKAVQAPAWGDVPGFKSYDDKEESALEARDDRIGGRRTFRRALVPTAGGEFTITPPAVAFFEPRAGAYKTETPAAIALHVDAASVAEVLNVTAAAVASAAAKQEVQILADDIRPPHTAMPPLSPAATRRLEARLLSGSLVVPPCAFVLLLLLERRRRERQLHGGRERARRAARRAKGTLAEAQQAQAARQTDEAIALASRAVREFFGDKLGAAGLALTATDITARLQAAGIEAPVVARVHEILSELDELRFAGAAARAPALEAVLPRIAALLTELDRPLASLKAEAS